MSIRQQRCGTRSWKQSGYTLVEVICALVIISLSVIGILTLFSYGTGWVEKQGLRRQALGHVQSYLESLKACADTREHHDVAGCVSPPRTIVLKRRLWGESRDVVANLESVIGPVEIVEDLRYRQVTARLFYEDGRIGDEIIVSYKSYLY
jgi:prepilin-type N-terminal cleavage/methylation domain-containing protein